MKEDNEVEAAGSNSAAAAGPRGGATDFAFPNLPIKSSQVVGVGSPRHTLPELSQAHRIIELSKVRSRCISGLLVELYEKGLSTSDIAKQVGLAKSTVREALLKAGISLRQSDPTPNKKTKARVGKMKAHPPYGFCYFQGQLVPDQKEYGNLFLIHRLWKLKTNPNRLADTLNEKKITPRSANSWNRNSVIKILKRFEERKIVLKGGNFELR